MAKISVGRQYKQEFESIVELFRGGFLSDEVNIRRVATGLIETETHTFELSGTESNESTQRSHRYGKGGASWFAAFRGEEVEDNNSAWISLIDNVAKDYRKHYSFIEFKQEKTPQQRQKEQLLAQRLVDTVLTEFFPNITLAEVAKKPEVVDIFGLSMKLEIGNGVGQNEPVLCKLYFRKIDGEFEPLTKSQAHDIESFIENAVPNDEESKSVTLDKEYSDLVSQVFAALTRRIEVAPGTEDNDFTDYVLLSGEEKGSNIIAYSDETVRKDTDFNKIKFMLKHLGNSDEKILNCSRVEILGVSHVEWENSVYKVKQGEKNVLRLSVGVNDSFDISCLNCHGRDSVLVESNVIKGLDGKSWILDPSKENFGLSSVDIEQIGHQSVFSQHLFEVNCAQNTIDGCRRTVCASQVFTIGNDTKCSNCRHPEIVYVDIFDETSEPKRTQSLRFAMDRLTFVEEGGDTHLFECPCCKQTYTDQTKQIRGLCEHCANADNDPEGVRRYKQYRKMLSPGTRIKYLFKKKTCKEYNGLVIFTMGNDKYIFNALSVGEHGLLKSPTKYKRR